MNAAELRALAGALNYQSWSEWRTEDESKFAQAAEILELLAWAEEKKVDVHRGQYFWWWHNNDYIPQSDKTLIGLLRRAREAAR